MRNTLLLAALTATCIAAPTANALTLPDFLLVTSSRPDAISPSSSLPDVNATSLFDPNHQTDFYLRLIAPGYGSLPRFTISQGTLHTNAQNLLEGFQVEEYNSTKAVVGEELVFDPAPEGTGNLSLGGGYLLAVNEDTEGWTVCQGALEERVIFWKGSDPTCVKRYIHAVQDAPY